MDSQREALKEAAVVITWGKLVAAGNGPTNLVPGPTLETPWSASDHHSYPFIPRRGIPAQLLTSSLTFSAKVNLPMRSFTLSAVDSDVLQNGNVLVLPTFGSHANGSRPSPPTATTSIKVILTMHEREAIIELYCYALRI